MLHWRVLFRLPHLMIKRDFLRQNLIFRLSLLMIKHDFLKQNLFVPLLFTFFVGQIGGTEIKAFLAKLDCNISEEDMKSMIRMADKTGNGSLSFSGENKSCF